jgi:hypothetical protein
MKTYGYGWIPIVAFVTISGFVIVNLVIAVICNAVFSMDDDDKAKIHGDYDDDLDSSDETRPPVLREQIEKFEDQMDELLQAQKMLKENRFLTDHFHPKSRETKRKVARAQKST